MNTLKNVRNEHIDFIVIRCGETGLTHNEYIESIIDHPLVGARPVSPTMNAMNILKNVRNEHIDFIVIRCGETGLAPTQCAIIDHR